jgi:PAS domain S-box-containing protein
LSVFQAVDHPSFVAYFFIDNEGFLQDFDEQIVRIFNVPEADLRGMNIIENAGDQGFVASIRKALAGQTVFHQGQVSIIGRDPIKNFATYLRPIRSPHEGMTGVAGFVHYTKNGTVSPFEIVQQTEYYNLIAKNLHDIISVYSFDGKVLFLSPSFEQFTGIPSERVMHNGDDWPVHPEDELLVETVLNDVKNSGNTRVVEYRMIKGDGSVFWVESTFQVIRKSNQTDNIACITREITSRKEVEKALQYSENKYRNLIVNLPTGIVIIDFSGKIIEANNAFFSIICRPSADLDDLLTLPEVDERFNCSINLQLLECVEKNCQVEGQHEFQCDNGDRKHIFYSLVPVTDETGKVSAVMANVRDMTDLIKTETESRQQYEFLNMIINSLQEPFFVKDENHRWFMLNDACIRMMGYSRDEVIGKSDYDIYPKEQADVFWEKDNLVFQSGSNVNEEMITWSTGEVRTIVTSKYLYTDKLNGKKYIVGSIHDITRLKEIQETLKESERKFHDLFQNANDLIFTTDLKGNFTDANQRVVESLGIPLRKLLKSSIFDVVKNFGRKQLKEIMLQFREHQSVSALEVETVSANGSSMILEVHGRLMYKNDVAVGIQGIARDISEKIRYNKQLNQYNEELKELNKSKDKMFSIIAHDLKDPFNSLLGFSEILLEDYETLDREEMRDYIRIINNTAKHSLNLLENLLTWSRLLTGRLPFTPMKLLLASEVDTAMTIVNSLAYRKRITVDNLVPIEIAVFADQNMLLSILHNFIMNAIKFTNPGGKIEIDAGYVDSESPEAAKKVSISIKDNGIGMTKEEVEKLFQIKALYSTSGTQNEKGTGLGLLLTREMIERHGGTIQVTSKPKEGSTFSFILSAAF